MATRRTNNGAFLDIDALLAQQPASTRALGNMSINTRGDLLDSNSNVVKKNEDRVREYYQANPKSTTTRVSTKGKLAPDRSVEVESAAEAKITEEVKVAVKPEVEEVEEVELPNGDIEIRKKGKRK